MSIPEGCDERGFDKKTGLHNVTGTEFDKHGFDIDGYRLDGYDRDGYDRNEFNEVGIHKTTKTEFNENWFNKEGIHKTTKTRYAPNGYDINGFDQDGHHRNEYDDWDGDTGDEEDEYDSEEESYREVELSETSDIFESEAETGNISHKAHEEKGRK